MVGNLPIKLHYKTSTLVVYSLFMLIKFFFFENAQITL